MPIKTLEEFLKFLRITLCEKCPYSELFWSTYSCIQSEYGEIRSISLSISPYSVQIRKNADQNNSGQFLHSAYVSETSRHCYKLS